MTDFFFDPLTSGMVMLVSICSEHVDIRMVAVMLLYGVATKLLLRYDVGVKLTVRMMLLSWF